MLTRLSAGVLRAVFGPVAYRDASWSDSLHAVVCRLAVRLLHPADYVEFQRRSLLRESRMSFCFRFLHVLACGVFWMLWGVLPQPLVVCVNSIGVGGPLIGHHLSICWGSVLLLTPFAVSVDRYEPV